MFVCLFRPLLLSKCVCVLSRECEAEDFLSLRHKYLKGLGDRLRSGPDSPNKERNSLFLCPSKLLEYCCWLGGRMSQYKDVHCFFLGAETRAVHHGQDAAAAAVVFRSCISNSWWCGTKELSSQYSPHSDTGNASSVSFDFDSDLGTYFSQTFQSIHHNKP